MLGSWCLVMLAATVPAFAQTLTSTSTLTAIVTVSKCNPTNTECPLYTPSTTSTSSTPISTSSSCTTTSTSSLVNTTSTFYPTSNSTSFAGPTAYPNTTLSSYTTKAPTVAPSVTPTEIYPTATPEPTTAPTPEPTSGAGLVSLQSGLLVGILGLGAAFLG
ncbi:hypothetical protein MGN70_005332 [Eutypa lata]|uniref:Uncharacterized protein n=1 Tax=Eutypa lata (strain UCR-EL1) TaxID=1287681 RepID=M7SD02_EUTLA|nr:hypothetical protein UCREL1_11006 [Eutypa lata UCREL1]KAI1253124.1 hypothetical protein MGN70_005332 [Eutypa lata]